MKQKLFLNTKNEGGKVKRTMSDRAKTLLAIGASAMIGDVIVGGTVGEMEAIRKEYNRRHEVITVKDHFWSKPYQVYAYNGERVVK